MADDVKDQEAITQAVKAKGEARRQFMLEGPLTKVIFITALPMVVTMLVDSVYNMADTFFVSKLGFAATAAVGVNDSLMMVIRSIALGFGVGSSSYISRALGAKDDEKASRAASTTLFTAIVTLFLIATVGGSIFLSPLVDLLGATESVKPYSMDYARWILLSAPVTATTVCLSQMLRAEGNTKFAMWGTVSGCIINIVLDPLLITTFGLGVAGAAIATDISKLISACILLYPYIKRKCIIQISPKYFTPTREIYGEIAKMGIPTVLRTSMMSVSTITINNVAAGFGDVALAAISISTKTMKFIGSAIMGFGQGFQPVAGYSWGAKKYDRVLEGFKITTIIGAVIGIVFGGLLAIFAEPTIAIFSKDERVIELGRILIITQSVVLAPHMWIMIVTGFFQALGKPTQAAIMGLSRQLLALIPSVLILSHFFGETGLAVSQAASDFVSFTVALILIVPALKEIKKLANEQSSQNLVTKSVVVHGD